MFLLPEETEAMNNNCLPRKKMMTKDNKAVRSGNWVESCVLFRAKKRNAFCLDLWASLTQNDFQLYLPSENAFIKVMRFSATMGRTRLQRTRILGWKARYILSSGINIVKEYFHSLVLKS